MLAVSGGKCVVVAGVALTGTLRLVLAGAAPVLVASAVGMLEFRIAFLRIAGSIVLGPSSLCRRSGAGIRRRSGRFRGMLALAGARQGGGH